jgi:transaldolase
MTSSVTAARQDLQVQIFADGASLPVIRDLAGNPLIKGFTTNPTLMKQAGVRDYMEFCAQALELIGTAPISLEVFSDDFKEMKRQALRLASLAPSVYVKIPITNTHRESSSDLVRQLSQEGVKVNVTAIFTLEQVDRILPSLADGPGGYISIFAGRIADAGVDPVPTMSASVAKLKSFPHLQLIWASPREVLNVVQANDCGCHIITVTSDLLKKLSGLGKNLDDFSLETVAMFANDAKQAGYQL